ncbi:MAG: rhodanese-like domain-containing protein [Aureispira sp.]|nr:rhodanese-like domain-containing protein [Aureispira sp.]
MKNISILVFLLLVVASLSAQTTKNPAFTKKIEATIEHTIPVITSEQLQKKISTKGLVILDTREQNEYKVSHLPNAQQVGYDHFKLEDVKSIDKNAVVVVYCSIGYRSEKVGERLKANGYKYVYNLYGGIFEWVNAGFRVVDSKKQTTKKVHTYNKEWSKWLEAGTRIY